MTRIAWVTAALLLVSVACHTPRGTGDFRGHDSIRSEAPSATAQPPAGRQAVAQKDRNKAPDDTVVWHAPPRITGSRGYALPEYTEEVFQKRISLTVKDAELENVIRLLARQAGLNIVMNPAHVQGRVTVQLRDVPIGAALQAILRTNGLDLVRDSGNAFRVSPVGALRRNARLEQVVVHVPLSWVSAVEVKKILDPVVDGEIVADTMTNSVIIADTPKKVEEIVRIIRGKDINAK